MKYLLRLLNLRRNEVPRLVHAAAIFFLASIDDGIVKSVAAAVFNIRWGVEHLPLMYTWIAGLFALSMVLLSWLTAKVSRQRLLFGLLIAVEGVLLFNAAMLFVGQKSPRLFYPFLFVSSEIARSLTGFQLWIVAGYICYTSRAKALFPLLAASATLGDIAGGFVVRFLGRLLSSAQLYGLAALNLGLILGLLRSLVRRYFVAQPEGRERRSATLRDNLRYFGRSTYLQLLFVLSIAIFALYTAIHYGFNVVGRQHYPTEAGITSLFGLFYGCSGIATLIVSTLLLQRLLRWMGTGNVYLGVCVAYALVGLALAGVFAGAIALPAVAAIFSFNLVNFLLLDSIVAPTYQVLIKLIPARYSDGTRMLMEGGFMLLGGLAGAALTMLHASQTLSLAGLFLTLSGFSAVMVLCGWWLKRSYTQVLVQAVCEQGIDTSDEQAMRSLNQSIARSADLSRSLLMHRDDGVRQIGIEILRRNPGPWVEQICLPLLECDNPRIRSAALEALGPGSAGGQTATLLLSRLDDVDEEVQVCAAKALGRILEPGSAHFCPGLKPEQREEILQAVLPRLAMRGRAELQAEYLVILERLGHPESSRWRRTRLEDWLDSSDSEELIAGVQAAGRLQAVEWEDRLLGLLRHPHPAVREAAVVALGGLNGEPGFRALLGVLADPDPDVVKAAVTALAKILEGPRRQAMVAALAGQPLRAWEGLMAALLEMDDPRLVPDLMASCRQRLVEANRYLVAIDRLRAQPSQPSLELLIDQLNSQNLIAQNGVVRLLGYLADVQVVGDLLDRLVAADEEGRENAIELLENIADRELMIHLLPLLETDPEIRLAQAQALSGWERVSLKEALAYLLRSEDPWTRRAAAWAAGDLGWEELFEALPGEVAVQVREYREESERRRGEEMVAEDLPLTTLEKITFLKESEFFAALPLEELYHIALSMEEESVRPGTVVIEEGTRGDKMYIVVRGRLEVRKGEGQPIAVLREKQVFGDMALLDDQPRSASVIALEETHLLSLQRSSLERLLRRYSSIAFNLLRILSRRLRQSMED